MTSHEASDSNAHKNEITLDATTQEDEDNGTVHARADVEILDKQSKARSGITTTIERTPTNDRPYSSFTTRQKATPQDGTEKEKANIRKRKWDVLASPTIVSDPETAILLLYMGIIYTGFYAISASLTVQFHNIYGLSSTLQGFLFIPQVVGTILATITNTRILDGNFRRHALKAGLEVDRKRQGDLTKMPIERARLEIGMPFFAFGGHFHHRLWMAFGTARYTTMVGFNTLSVLVINLHRKRAATASAASNLVRCLLGAGASAATNPMIEAMRNGWTLTLVGLVELATLPLLVVMIKVG
ncbi:uncharacterized protein Z519_02301 [Cladophialophora bantiana CBS 173.52]|uniref:Major facilitator superfamily (MFS) profile domain-containing protein n=1 Tax=Cladophialophora bantiana (strain ATCC 10958 / CBS 173.52 / CDC B-1940 / NIH 8579) TaxID=1442370 RepID=A0A0D2I156_CLAB1|nr:uncharacterized protein Z519_02301 [Cladophialophora bantiana CBS 173.52]KIW96910.1 hypothetical protein Z519_02301 [Cladophialophora bantiana CBS 173.52]